MKPSAIKLSNIFGQKGVAKQAAASNPVVGKVAETVEKTIIKVSDKVMKLVDRAIDAKTEMVVRISEKNNTNAKGTVFDPYVEINSISKKFADGTTVKITEQCDAFITYLKFENPALNLNEKFGVVYKDMPYYGLRKGELESYGEITHSKLNENNTAKVLEKLDELANKYLSKMF